MPLFGLLILLYGISLLPVFFKPRKSAFITLNRALGKWEYAINPLRDALLFPLFALGVSGSLVMVWLSGSPIDAELWSELTLLPVGLWVIRRKRARYRHHADIAYRHPQLHPQAFFTYVYDTLGPWPHLASFPTQALDLEAASFVGRKPPGTSIVPMLKGAIDTLYLAHAAMIGVRHVPKNEVHDRFDAMAVMWGKRMLARFCGSLRVTGEERLKDVKGKVILVFNHLSQLDFMLSFFALSRVRLASGRKLRIRFVVAKDHFKDNVVLYHLIGVGRVIETVGMVFVDRKTKGKGYENLRAAAQAFVANDVDIAIYPQGTRGKSYYSTFTQKTALLPLGHLRRGLAHFVQAVASALDAHPEYITLIPVGIVGTETVLPKGRIRVKRGGEIGFHIGTPLCFSPQELTQMGDTALLEQVDEALLHVLHYHERLLQRFLDRLDTGKRASAQLRLAALPADLHRLAMMSLDRLYTLKADEWPVWEERVEYCLGHAVGLEEWKALLGDVSRRVLD